MKIAIYGSWKEDNPPWQLFGKRQDFVDACSSIGKKLAQSTLSIVVGPDSEDTADYHITRNFAKIANPDRSKVIVLSAKPKKPYSSLAKDYPKLFSFPLVKGKRGNVNTHLRNLKEVRADVVLTVGGGRNTYLAGLAAIIAKKRVIPIPTFGGGSEQLLKDLCQLNPSSFTENISQLNGPWIVTHPDLIIELVSTQKPLRILIIHGRSDDYKKLKDLLLNECKTAVEVDVLVMQENQGPGKTFPEKFEELASSVDIAIALATPDDLGRLKGEEDADRARQNVWLEYGWVWGRLGRDRVMLLRKGEPEHPSDIHGLEYFQYNESPAELIDKIIGFVSNQSFMRKVS